MKFAEVKGKFSCKDCKAPKRHLGCHETCPDYLRDKMIYEQDKAEAQKRYDYDRVATALSVRRFAMSNHRKLYQN